MAVCEVCFRHCDISEGKRGACLARECRDGHVIPVNYGCITSLALDPIEKKPLRRFFPGSKILSAGSYGCNLFCPFCQNHDISRSDGTGFEDVIDPEALTDIAVRYKDRGNIGIAYTYNEPLTGYVFVRDTAKLVRDAGLKNVLVSNGTAAIPVLEELLPYIDAMNIDIKSMSEQTYRDFLGGDLFTVREFIKRSVSDCHVELTMLIVPGMNDTDGEMRELTEWISGLKDKDGNLIGPGIPLHISRFFPRYKVADRPPTDIGRILALAEIAKEKLRYVYTGNI